MKKANENLYPQFPCLGFMMQKKFNTRDKLEAG